VVLESDCIVAIVLVDRSVELVTGISVLHEFQPTPVITTQAGKREHVDETLFERMVPRIGQFVTHSAPSARQQEHDDVGDVDENERVA
jgi:hypothetical protein